MGQQRRCAPWGHVLTPSPGAPLGLRCRPSPACPLPPRLPSTVTGGAEGHGAADRLMSLAGAGGSTDSDYGGGRYHRGHGVSSGIVGWDGMGGACAPTAQHPVLCAPQAQWRRQGQSPASPAPWPWHSSGPSPATSPISRRSSASASSVSPPPQAPQGHRASTHLFAP